MINMT